MEKDVTIRRLTSLWCFTQLFLVGCAQNSQIVGQQSMAQANSQLDGEAHRVTALMSRVYQTGLTYCRNTSAAAALGSSSSTTLASNPLATTCVPPPIQRPSRDTGFLQWLIGVSQQPFVYYMMTTGDGLEDIVSKSAALNQNIESSTWGALLDDLSSSLTTVRAGLPPDASSAVKDAPLQVVYSIQLLTADTVPGSYVVSVSPGIVRGFYAMCHASMYTMMKIAQQYDDCAGLAYLSNTVHDIKFYNSQAACNVIQGRQMIDINALVPSFRSCVKESSAFVFAHELSHMYLGHTASTVALETDADDCAKMILLRASLPFAASAGATLLRGMEKSTIAGLISPEQHRDLDQRITKISLPPSARIAEKCGPAHTSS